MNQPAKLTINGSRTYLNLTFPRFKLSQGWNLINIYYERYDSKLLKDNTNKLYIFDRTNRNFKQLSNSMPSETEVYWIYLNKEVEISNPEEELPSLELLSSLGLLSRIIDIIKKVLVI
jgi:hypothetical protein